jgi:hypothetical protein
MAVATRDRRLSRPRAKRDILDGSGGVIRKGETIPRGAIPTRDIDRLGAHGFVERRKGDDGIDRG